MCTYRPKYLCVRKQLGTIVSVYREVTLCTNTARYRFVRIQLMYDCVRIERGTFVWLIPLCRFTPRYHCVRIQRGTLCTYTARYLCVGIERGTVVYVYSEVPLSTYTARYHCIRIQRGTFV